MQLRNISARSLVLRDVSNNEYRVPAYSDLTVSSTLWNDSTFRQWVRMRIRDIVVVDDVPVGGGSTVGIAPTGNQIIQPTGPAITPLILKGAASQTVDLLQWQNSAGTVLARVSSTGVFTTTGGFGAAITSADIQNGTLVDADINASAAIAYGKLSLTNSLVNADVNSAAAIAYSKLNLAASITNSDIAPAAGIPYSKLTLTNSVVTADITDGAINSAKIADATITGTDIAAGVGHSHGTAFPTTGLFNGYRFTLFTNGGVFDFIYRVDLDAVYPWHCIGGTPIRVTASSSSVAFAGMWDVEAYTAVTSVGAPAAGSGLLSVNAGSLSGLTSITVNFAPTSGSESSKTVTATGTAAVRWSAATVGSIISLNATGSGSLGTIVLILHPVKLAP